MVLCWWQEGRRHVKNRNVPGSFVPDEELPSSSLHPSDRHLRSNKSRDEKWQVLKYRKGNRNMHAPLFPS